MTMACSPRTRVTAAARKRHFSSSASAIPLQSQQLTNIRQQHGLRAHISLERARPQQASGAKDAGRNLTTAPSSRDRSREQDGMRHVHLDVMVEVAGAWTKGKVPDAEATAALPDYPPLWSLSASHRQQMICKPGCKMASYPAVSMLLPCSGLS